MEGWCESCAGRWWPEVFLPGAFLFPVLEGGVQSAYSVSGEMIKCLIIASFKSGGVIFQRFYGSEFASTSNQAVLLQKLRDSTASEWPNLLQDHPEQCAYIDGMHVHYKLIDDVVLSLVGVDEHDQLLLLEFSRAFEAALVKVLNIKPNSAVSMETRLLTSYSKLSMIVEEMILDGEIDHLDANIIASVVKM